VVGLNGSLESSVPVIDGSLALGGEKDAYSPLSTSLLYAPAASPPLRDNHPVDDRLVIVLEDEDRARNHIDMIAGPVAWRSGAIAHPDGRSTRYLRLH
jgi:hypothetical protein